jgi:6-pyruvoyl-tetrahydropterin synthase
MGMSETGSMPMKRMIVVRTQFNGLHSWPECPIDSVAFLRYEHRHTFHVAVEFEVGHADRQLEFIKAQQAVDQAIRDCYGFYNQHCRLGHSSCEMIAETLMRYFISKNMLAYKVTVSEDGVFDGVVIREDE